MSSDPALMLFGWIDFPLRTIEQMENHERIVAAMPEFPAQQLYRDDKGRYALWNVGEKHFGSRLKYNFQQTGSCVGAAWGNMTKTMQRVEIALGDLEVYKEIWWPFTYGRGRLRGGMSRPGEGSFGSAQAEAAIKDGCLAIEDKPDLPQFTEQNGWLVISGRTEISWSDGDAQQSIDCLPIAVHHLFKAAAVIKGSSEARAAIQNGYALTLASNFGTRDIRPVGSPAVNVGTWSDNWAHQMYCDEAWDHPTEGLIFRIGNNWGPNAHPSPTQGEPVGGFYIRANTFDRICQTGEVYAFSGLAGWKVRLFDLYA